MPTAKIEAIGQITRAINGLETAIAALQLAYPRATFTEKTMILEKIGELGERLNVNRLFLAHMRATEVTVTRASRDEYSRLDRALARLQRMDVETDAVRRILSVTGAVASAVKSTRRRVSQRTS